MADGSPGQCRVEIDLNDVAAAFEDHSGLGRWFLDLATGKTIYVSEEVQEELRRLDQKTEEATPDSPAFREALQRRNLPDCEREALEEAARIGVAFGERYIAVEPEDPSESYRDMEDFVETVSDLRLQERLWKAIQGRRPSRGFKDVLESRSPERERWFEFRNSRLRNRVIEWLREEGIEPM